MHSLVELKIIKKCTVPLLRLPVLLNYSYRATFLSATISVELCSVEKCRLGIYRRIAIDGDKINRSYAMKMLVSAVTGRGSKESAVQLTKYFIKNTVGVAQSLS